MKKLRSKRLSKRQSIIDFELTDKEQKEIDKAKEKYTNYIEKYKYKTALMEKLDRAIKRIYHFDTNNPDLSQKETFFTINSINEEEKSFSDNFSNFEEIIKKEGKTNKLKRRNNYFIQRNLENKINQEEELSKFISELEITHQEEMKINQQEKDLDKLLPTCNENFEKEIYTKENMFNRYNSPIGNFGSTETLIYRYSFHENYHLMINAYRHFNYWRPSLSDGNSFYRVFMYSLIENYITNQNINELKKLICDIIQEDYITLYRNKGIDVYIVLQIFNKILFLLENNQIEESYKIFNKAYRLKNHCFDYTMIFYLRNIVYKYTKQIVEMYKTRFEKNYDENDNIINIDAINEFGTEPEFFIILFIQDLFDVNLRIFWVDRNFEKPEDGIINLIDDENEGKFPYIIMGYFFSSFFPLYSSKINENLQYFIDKCTITLKQLTYCDENKKICPICNKETKQVIFLQKRFIICKPCLICYLDKMIMNRTLNIKNEDYYGFEYYNRPIHLQDDYYINNYEIIELKNENLSNLFIKYQQVNCSQCNVKTKLNKSYIMNCNCIYCKQCFVDNLEFSTGGYMCINGYEKRNTKFEKISCKCGKDFHINEALLLYQPTEEEINDAKERMNVYINTLCCECFKKLADYYNRKNDYKIINKIHFVNIKQENEEGKGIEYNDIQHLICNDCYLKKKKLILMEKITDEKRKEEETSKEKIRKIFCNICNKYHYQIIDSDERNSCCSDNCKIF